MAALADKIACHGFNPIPRFPPAANFYALSSDSLLLQGADFSGTGPSLPYAPVKAKWPTSEADWLPHAVAVRKLYLEENRPLKDVVTIMERDHGFKATARMFKFHIKKWKLDKRNKAADVKALVRKITQRDALGKDSTFYIRGRPANVEDAFRYLKRTKTSIENVLDQPSKTPPDLHCFTPEPVPPLIAPPSALEIPNRILIQISHYMEGSFDSGTWIPGDKDEFCISVNARRNEFEALASVFRNISRARRFINQGWNSHAGHLLVKGAAGIQDILSEDQPRMLAQFCCSMFGLQSDGRHDISDIFMKQFRSMSITLFPKTHPLRRIFTDFCNIESAARGEAFIKVVELYITTLEHRLGRYAPTTHQLRLEYLYGTQLLVNPDGMESSLLAIVDECAKLFPHTDGRYWRTIYMNGLMFSNLAKFAEAQACVDELLRIADIYDEDAESSKQGQGVNVAILLCAMEIQARYQVQEGNQASAEATQRQAIGISMDHYGRYHHTTLHYQAELTKCLALWGRTAEAGLLAEQVLHALEETSAFI